MRFSYSFARTMSLYFCGVATRIKFHFIQQAVSCKKQAFLNPPNIVKLNKRRRDESKNWFTLRSANYECKQRRTKSGVSTCLMSHSATFHGTHDYTFAYQMKQKRLKSHSHVKFIEKTLAISEKRLVT